MTGREKCKALRAIRRKIAKLNGIEYKPAVCRHKGPCAGVCPKCEKEAAYLMDELNRIKASRKTIKTDPDCMKKFGEISQIEPEEETVTLGIAEPVGLHELAGVPAPPIQPDDDIEVLMGNPVINKDDMEK